VLPAFAAAARVPADAVVPGSVTTSVSGLEPAADRLIKFQASRYFSNDERLELSMFNFGCGENIPSVLGEDVSDEEVNFGG